MGWASANPIFDETARKLIEVTGWPAMSDLDRATIITEVLSVLIREMQDEDWDTEGESLEEFKDNEAVVEAFRRNDIIIECGEHLAVPGEGDFWCERERGTPGHKDGMHEDRKQRKWPAKTGS